MTDKATPPDFILKEAARRSNANPELSIWFWRDMYRTNGQFTALYTLPETDE